MSVRRGAGAVEGGTKGERWKGEREEREKNGGKGTKRGVWGRGEEDRAEGLGHDDWGLASSPPLSLSLTR